MTAPLLHACFAILIMSLVGMGFAQSPEQAAPQPQGPSAPDEEESPIQDNSFLLEEAYNQEYGVVQHISAFQRLWESKQWAYNFTQEWPVNPRPRHQLSYTLPFLSAGGALGSGIGDIVLNYRYQLHLAFRKSALCYDGEISRPYLHVPRQAVLKGHEVDLAIRRHTFHPNCRPVWKGHLPC